MKKRILGTEEVLYRFGLAAALVAVAGCLLWQLAPQGLHDWWKQYSFCMLYRFTGFTCPGCGGTRAFAALLQGRLIESFLYHPLVLYGGMWYLCFMGSHTMAWIGRKVSPSCSLRGMKWKNGYVITAVILLAANFIIKNLIHLMTGADVLAVLGQWFG